VLGSIADQSGARKPWIGFFAVIKISSLFCLWFASPGSPVLYPVIFMILASIKAEDGLDGLRARRQKRHDGNEHDDAAEI
ncbi:hypothetical protein AB9F39_38500, partial [Rhizobium leguminosarum]